MNAEAIELFNAHGPFDHGVWTFVTPGDGELKFGEESLFQSRAERMATSIVTYLTAAYTAEELARRSILDVGCYDGWILTRIAAQIDFKLSVGVDPRRKNLEKGAYARQVCGIDTSTRFVQGGYEDLARLFPDTAFDIVLCLGLIHHVSSTFDAIRVISAHCSEVLIVDTMVVPELRDDKASIEPMVNTRDIIYRGVPADWAIAAFKYESPYFDGSTDQYRLVNIPQEDLLRMSLVASGFEAKQRLMTERDYYPDSSQNVRGVQEVMLASTRTREHGSVREAWVERARAYENLYCNVVLNALTLRYLVDRFGFEELRSLPSGLGSDSLAMPADLANALDRALSDPGALDATDRATLARHHIGAEELEILTTIPRAPLDKILLELGKSALQARRPAEARHLFQRITQKPNADWRSFYRACYLLWTLEDLLGNKSRSDHYKHLLDISNELFPLGLPSQHVST